MFGMACLTRLVSSTSVLPDYLRWLFLAGILNVASIASGVGARNPASLFSVYYIR